MYSKRVMAFCLALVLSIAVVNFSSIRETINWHRQDALAAAAWNGDISTVKLLLYAGADVNLCVGGRGCPIHSAVWNGHVEVVRFLLDKGANVNRKWKLGSTPLMVAAANGQTEIAKLLLTRGADVNPRDDFGTALEAASEQGHNEIVKLLLANGAGTNGNDERALRRAILNNHADAARLLLAHGVNLDRSGDDINNDIPSVLQIAVEQGNSEIVDLLKKAGAK